MSFLNLQSRYPWPDVQPDVPEDGRGWCHGQTAAAIKTPLSSETELAVECGTWLGYSARVILKAAPNAKLICIDTWPSVRETCQRNLWQWRERLVLMQEDTIVGLGLVYAAGLRPDMIYLDSAHTLGRVTAELAVCRELFPGAAVVGDDYTQRAVKQAARHHAELFKRELIECGVAAFRFDPTGQ